MKQPLVLTVLVLLSRSTFGIQAPTNIISAAGDLSVIVHWDRSTDPTLAGYRVYRSTTGPGGPFSLVNNPINTLLPGPGYCDISGKVVDGQTNFYYATAVDTNSQESLPSGTVSALPQVFANNDAFLDYIQRACFFYFWYAGNPANGLVPDRSAAGSACSIAVVGFGLTAIGIAADHGWITHQQAASRVLTTLNTFLLGPQGSGSSGFIGYNGWFYHFLDMNTALRANNSELSSIDTVLLLGGILYVKQYFNGNSPDEVSIRSAADAIFNRVNWTFMSQGSNAVAMGWLPGSGFSTFGNWIGYDEGMLIYILGLGTTTNPLPASAWSYWTGGYTWGTLYGQTFIPFPPLFGHQYSHCWVDFRYMADPFMNSHNSTYFENSRRASLAQVAYCSGTPPPHTGYSSNVWGLTACDCPAGYIVCGLPPAGTDNGTIAPTAAGGSMPFTPEYSLPALQHYYSNFRIHIWTEYGFHDAFNLGQSWYDSDELGIDQGPIAIMIENYRTQRVWQLFMRNAEVQRGLQRAGFVSLPFMPLSLQALPAESGFNVTWPASNGRYYQVEYSPQLLSWAASPGFVLATNTGSFNWLDTGPPATASAPGGSSQRFYRVFQVGAP